MTGRSTFAAAVIVAGAFVGAVWLARDRPPAEPARPPSPVAAARSVRVPTVVAVVSLGSSRAASAAPIVQLPRGESEIELRVRLNPADRYERYAMELRSTADRVVWRASDLKSSINAGDLLVTGIVPSHALEGGSYELAVRGGSSELGFVSLTVRRTP
jgi:hypothetical protein